MTVNEMVKANKSGGDFGSMYMLQYFAEYVNDDSLYDDSEFVTEMLCCIHNGFGYSKGLYQKWNSEEEFNFFDKYNLLEDDFTEEVTKFKTEYSRRDESTGTFIDEVRETCVTHKVRYFRKEFVDTFIEEDWYLSSLEEEARDYIKL